MTYEHVAECLHLTFATLRAAGPEFDLRIKISIASVGELTEYAANRAFKIENFVKDNKCPVAWRSLFDNSPWIERLRRSGQCPSQIEIIMHTSTTLQSLHFFASVHEPTMGGRHELCNSRTCVAHQNNLSSYSTQHVTVSCNCKEYLVDSSSLDEVLKAGNLPLLRIREGKTLDDLTVEIVVSQPVSRYVALSHVWADGLGNPEANALPRCQLLHLSRLAQSLALQASSEAPLEELLFWCDTLCCPTAPPDAKKRALTQMKRTYQDATCVLVLDASLKLHDSKTMSPEEPCARILISGWMRRLWILQEGALPANQGRLWFQLCDRAVNIRPIQQQILEVLYTDLSRRGLAVDIFACIRSFTTFFHHSPSDPGADIATLDRALQDRSVSVSSDEPLLIGTLLGLDVAEILNEHEDSRIHRM